MTEQEQVTSTTALSSSATERLPDHIVVSRGLNGLVVVSHKKNWGMTAVLGAFAALWDLMCLTVLHQAPVLFWFTHGGAGVAVTLTFLNAAFNRTHLEVAHKRLRARRRPLPWFGGVDVALDDVGGFVVDDGRVKVNGRPLRALWLEKRDGSRALLLDALPDEEHGERLAAVMRQAVDEARAR